MPAIKFSHLYSKMPGGVQDRLTYLIGCQPINLEKLPPKFLEYDTDYFDYKAQDIKHYLLPKKGKYMILFLLTDDTLVWTTIRRWTPSKYNYYVGLVGSHVEIQIDEMGS